MMFCQYCGSKIANDNIEFYTEDSKTARTETVIDAITKILGTKEQRMAEKERKDKLISTINSVLIFILLKEVESKWKLT